MPTALGRKISPKTSQARVGEAAWKSKNENVLERTIPIAGGRSAPASTGSGLTIQTRWVLMGILAWLDDRFKPQDTLLQEAGQTAFAKQTPCFTVQTLAHVQLVHGNWLAQAQTAILSIALSRPGGAATHLSKTDILIECDPKPNAWTTNNKQPTTDDDDDEHNDETTNKWHCQPQCKQHALRMLGSFYLAFPCCPEN